VATQAVVREKIEDRRWPIEETQGTEDCFDEVLDEFIKRYNAK
jgi:hypothetical protein